MSLSSLTSPCSACKCRFHVPIVRVCGAGHEARARELLGQAQKAWSRGEMLAEDVTAWLVAGGEDATMPKPLYDWEVGQKAVARMWRDMKATETSPAVSEVEFEHGE